MSDETTPASRSRDGAREPDESAREPDGEPARVAEDDAKGTDQTTAADPAGGDESAADSTPNAAGETDDADSAALERADEDSEEDSDAAPVDDDIDDAGDEPDDSGESTVESDSAATASDDDADDADESDESGGSTADPDEPDADRDETETETVAADATDGDGTSGDDESSEEDSDTDDDTTDSTAEDRDADTEPDGEPVPAVPKQRSPLWAKLMVAFGALLFLFAGSAAVVGKLTVDRFNNAIPQADLLGDNRVGGQDYEEAAGTDIEGPLNYLLIGTDQRGGEDAEIERSDTIIMLHIDEDLENAYLVSIPRDLLVTITDCGGGEPCDGKINAATYYGGPEPRGAVSNLANTLTDLTGVEFDGAALVGFENFLNLVETLGGVEVCLPETITSIHGDNQTYPEGCDHYNHEETLDIVRQRYQYSDGDYGRQRMQQHVLRQLLAEAASQGYMSDPNKIGTLLDRLGDSMLVDLGGIRPVDLALEMRYVNASELNTVRLPSEPANINGISYVVIQPGEQEEQAESLFEAIREDELDTWLYDNPDFVNET